MTRRIIVLVCALGICGYAGFLVVTDFGRLDASRGDRIGKPLCPGLDGNTVERIRISSANGSLELDRDAGSWRVDNQLRYPADGIKIKELFDALGRIKVLNSHDVGDADLTALDLNNPVGAVDGRGRLLEFLDGDNRLLVGLIVGRDHRSIGDEQVADGRFVRRLGDRTVCVVPYLFPGVEIDGSLWLDRSFPSSKLTRRIVLRDGDAVLWGFSRENRPDAMVMANLPAGETLDSDVVSRLENAVKFAKFSRVATTTDSTSISFGNRVFEYEAFDGFVYVWALGDALVDDRLLPVKVTVSLANGIKSTKKMNDRLRREQAHYDGWIYLLSRSTFAPLQMDVKEFLKATK